MVKDDNSANGGTDQSSTGKDGEIKDPSAVLAKNQELLSKLKSQGEKMKSLEEQLNGLKTEKLSTEGKKDELIEALKSQLNESKKKETQLGWNIVSSQVAVEASKRGCVNVDTLMKVVDFGSAEIDTASFRLASDDISLMLDKASKDHPYLFKSEAKKPRDGGFSHDVDLKTDFSKMKTSDLLNEYKKHRLKEK